MGKIRRLTRSHDTWSSALIALLSSVPDQIELRLGKQLAVVGGSKVLNINQAAVAIVLTPAAVIFSSALQLSEGLIARNQPAILSYITGSQ
jgi:hypothetical protein